MGIGKTCGGLDGCQHGQGGHQMYTQVGHFDFD